MGEMLQADQDEPPPSDEPARCSPSPRLTNESARADIDDRTRSLAHAALSWLHDHADRALRELGAQGELRAAIVGDDEMTTAHERHCNAPGTTDVITFDLSGDPAHLDADLLVCASEAARQAARRAHPVERELLLYIVHGALHCMGYDDHDEDDARRMHEREDEVLRAIGVGVTFGRAHDEGPDS